MYSQYQPQLDVLSLENCGMDDDGQELSPWDKYVLTGFGSLVPNLGSILEPRIEVEMMPDDDLGDGTYRTPMLELSASDFEYVNTLGFGYPGMLALGDTGALYEYQPAEPGALSGWFKRIKKGIKKLAKKGFKAGKRVITKKVQKLRQSPISKITKKWKGKVKFGKKLLAKTKWGRTLIRVGSNVLNTTMKIVKPLAKHVGKWAPRLAPVAALIPGVGPAVMQAMLKAGDIANTFNRYAAKYKDVLVVNQRTGKTQRVKKLVVAPDKKRGLIRTLKRQAAQMARRPARERAKLIEQLKYQSPKRYARPVAPISRASRAAAKLLSRRAKQDYSREIQQKVYKAAGNNPTKQRRISALVKELYKLGYNVG